MGKLSNKITSIAAGEAHTVALTGDGSVFSWGRGMFGRLGTGKEEDETRPVPVEFIDASSSSDEKGSEKLKFIGIAAGAYHSLALQVKNVTAVINGHKMMMDLFGHGATTFLGNGEENSYVPVLVDRFQELGASDSLSEESDANDDKTPFKVSAIKAGGMMSLAIDNLGALWIWGNCPLPTTSNDTDFTLTPTPSPFPVWNFHGHTVVKVACGNEHIVAAVSAGESYTGDNLICYSWGNNSHGQLGLGDNLNRTKPQPIPSFNKDSSFAVYQISCGAFHSAILTHTKSYDQEIEYMCWTFGLGDNGQLGHGTTLSSTLPKPIHSLPQEAILISVDCGLFHTAVVSVTGDVWCWGMEKGLGLCPDASFSGNDAGDALLPVRVDGQFSNPIQIACGAAHTVLVTDDGYRVWAWGRGRSGVLGRGDTRDSVVPCAVMWPVADETVTETSVRSDAAAGYVTERGESGELKERLEMMERYANVLHISIFRKPLDVRSVQKSLGSGVFDVMREVEKMMDSAETEELARMEMFYRSMLSEVKDKLMKRRVQEMVKDCLISMSQSRRGY